MFVIVHGIGTHLLKDLELEIIKQKEKTVSEEVLKQKRICLVKGGIKGDKLRNWNCMYFKMHERDTN